MKFDEDVKCFGSHVSPLEIEGRKEIVFLEIDFRG